MNERYTFHTYVHGGAVQVIVRRVGNGSLLGRLMFESMAEWHEFKRRHVPELCEGYRCANYGEPGCFITDPTTGDRLPACAEHDQSEESSAEPREAA